MLGWCTHKRALAVAHKSGCQLMHTKAGAICGHLRVGGEAAGAAEGTQCCSVKGLLLQHNGEHKQHTSNSACTKLRAASLKVHAARSVSVLSVGARPGCVV
mmetsp:Transcript_26499/g.78696  ORF Transcript_26499/g.78696 Transcript_26499/m.78696 type:complete len:101 (-) Transcript_26499:2054-2356(-)